jgi:hypothetical protein
VSLTRVFALTAVLEDGSDRAVTLPDLRTPIAFPRSAPVHIDVTVVNPQGAPVDLTGLGVRLYFAKTPSGPWIFQKAQAAASGQAGTPVRMTLAASDTSGLEPGAYVYEVWLYTTATPSDTTRVIPPTAVRLEATVRP